MKQGRMAGAATVVTIVLAAAGCGGSRPAHISEDDAITISTSESAIATERVKQSYDGSGDSTAVDKAVRKIAGVARAHPCDLYNNADSKNVTMRQELGDLASDTKSEFPDATERMDRVLSDLPKCQ